MYEMGSITIQKKAQLLSLDVLINYLENSRENIYNISDFTRKFSGQLKIY